jgi:hypothetical protein
MVRTFFFALVVVVAGCATVNPSGLSSKSGEDATKSDGQGCSHDSECSTLWCVNGGCERREP